MREIEIKDRDIEAAQEKTAITTTGKVQGQKEKILVMGKLSLILLFMTDRN